MSTSKRKGQKEISYQEVDSDFDMDSDEEEKVIEMKGNGGDGDELEDRKKAGDTYGTTTKSKKKQKTGKGIKKNDKKPTYNVQLLLNLPFDLFAETCTHLEGSDLLSLALVNKSLRKILLSRHSRSIWSASRKRDGFPLPEGMSEIALCQSMNDDSCQVCGKTAYFKRNFFLRVRLCQDHRKTHFIAQNKLSSQWQDRNGKIFIHQLSNAFVFSTTVPDSTAKLYLVRSGLLSFDRSFNLTICSIGTYLVSELAEVDEELKDLAEEDEIALAQIESTFGKSSTRSRRGTGSSATQVEANAVSSFVTAKQQWVLAEQQLSTQLEQVYTKREDDEIKAKQAVRQAERDRIDAEAEVLQESYGWTEAEASRFNYNSRYKDSRYGNSERNPPSKSISEDPAAWRSYRKTIQQALADTAARRAELIAQSSRQDRLQPLFRKLQLSVDPSWVQVFPTFHHFVRLEHVKPLWQENEALVQDKALRKAQKTATPAIRQDLQEFFDSVKLEVIRHILAANQGVHISTISSDPIDYDNSTYDDDFFCRATSLLSSYDWQQGHLLHIGPFPAFSTTATWTYYQADIRNLKSVQQTRAIRAMIEAAGLDEETTTMADLEELGERFCWLNHPGKTMRKTKYDWLTLLDIILRRGPSNAKVLAGNGVEISYSPPNDSDAGKSDEDEGD